MKKLIQVLVLSFAVLSAGVVVAEPTVKEIYQTAQTDRAQALNMINQVIKNRPNSARAYYIQSELLLQMGKKAEAKAAFLKSQSLDPALSFARPESVGRLRGALGFKSDTKTSVLSNPMLLAGGLLVLAVIALIVFMRRKPTQPISYNGASMPTHEQSLNRPITPYSATQSAPTAQQPGAPMPQAQAPAGNGLMGSLAQGAAMGVGVAAGATLANHLLNGNKASAAPVEPTAAAAPTPSYTPDTNFGISDSGGDWGGNSGGDWGGDSGSSDDSGGDW